MLKNADSYIKAAMQTTYADMFQPVEVNCKIKMIQSGKKLSVTCKFILGDGSFQSLAESIEHQGIRDYLEKHIRIGNKREQILLSNEELINEVCNNDQNRAAVIDIIDFLRKELHKCEKLQQELNGRTVRSI